MKKFTIHVAAAIVLLMAVACTPAGWPTPPAISEESVGTTPTEPAVITLMTHDSFNVSEEVIAEFEAANNVQVKLLPSGDTGAALNQAILSQNNPLADVFFGVDNTFMSRALAEDIFEPYESPQLADIPDELELDPEYHLLPVDYGDVCLNYDRTWFAERGVTPPANLEALIDPAYQGLTVVENPATSSPGLAFLLATIGHFGEEGYLGYWQALRDNDVLVVDGWEEAYWGQFSAASDGDRPIVVSYATSPPVEVLFAEEPLAEAPTAAVVGDGACFRQIEFVGILRGTAERNLAEKLIDFMLGQRFQEDIPLQMFVFPANETAALPEIFVEYSQIPEDPTFVPPEKIEENRAAWLEAWTETVLR